MSEPHGHVYLCYTLEMRKRLLFIVAAISALVACQSAPAPIPISPDYERVRVGSRALVSEDFEGTWIRPTGSGPVSIAGTAPEGWNYQSDSAGRVVFSPAVFDETDTALQIDVVEHSGPFRFVRVLEFSGDEHTKESLFSGSMRVAGSEGTRIHIVFKNNNASGPHGDYYIRRTVELGEEWQELRFVSSYADSSTVAVGVEIEGPGRIYLDDVILNQQPADYLAELAPVEGPVPIEFFGMHFRLRVPPLTFGSSRLWGQWYKLEESKGDWTRDLLLLDRFVDVGHEAGKRNIMVVGRVPQWANSKPEEETGDIPGTTGPPADIEDWKDYIRELGTRYQGKVTYWEIWNEPNSPSHYTGDILELVELVAAAREVLLSIDPENVIISPPFYDNGAWLDDFLFHGGGEQVDVIGYHWYAHSPEVSLREIVAINRLLAFHGVDHKPVYNTEAATGEEATLPDAGKTARLFLVNWAAGVSNLNWFYWGNVPRHPKAPIQAVGSNDEVSIIGEAYNAAADWMIGAEMTEVVVLADGTWKAYLKRDERTTVAVWNPVGLSSIPLPDEWTITRAVNTIGEAVPVPTGKRLEVSPLPILYEIESGD